jgi:hypothetical protein
LPSVPRQKGSRRSSRFQDHYSIRKCWPAKKARPSSPREAPGARSYDHCPSALAPRACAWHRAIRCPRSTAVRLPRCPTRPSRPSTWPSRAPRRGAGHVRRFA